MVLVCHMILKNQIIKGSCDFMDQLPLEQVTTLSHLVTIWHCSSEDIMF